MEEVIYKRFPAFDKEWQSALEVKIANIENQTFHSEDFPILAKQIFSCIDLTSLNDSDTIESIHQFSKKARVGSHQVAAVCVYPKFLPAVSCLREQGIRLATVVNFPEGLCDSGRTCEEIQFALSSGADEIDLVFPYKDYLSGRLENVMQFLLACRKAASKVLLKVIIETGAFSDICDVLNAAVLCYETGADFTKTSTGKIAQGASLKTAAALCYAANHCQTFSSRTLGVKVSGGIKTVDQAISYFVLAREFMGENTIGAKRFRIGASQLVDSLMPHLL